MDRIRASVDAMHRQESVLLTERTRRVAAAARQATGAALLTAACFVGLLIAFLLIVREDLLGRARAEAAARESEERLRTTLRSIGDAVLATDGSGRVTFLNPVAERLTGWPAHEAAGKPVEEVFRIVNETTRAPVESPVRRVIREGAVVGLANHTDPPRARRHGGPDRRQRRPDLRGRREDHGRRPRLPRHHRAAPRRARHAAAGRDRGVGELRDHRRDHGQRDHRLEPRRRGALRLHRGRDGRPQDVLARAARRLRPDAEGHGRPPRGAPRDGVRRPPPHQGRPLARHRRDALADPRRRGPRRRHLADDPRRDRAAPPEPGARGGAPAGRRGERREGPVPRDAVARAPDAPDARHGVGPAPGAARRPRPRHRRNRSR